MARCPNCGAELAPSVLSCGNCRMPVHPGAGPSPQSDDTVIRLGDGSHPSSPDGYWNRAAQEQPARPYTSSPPPGPTEPTHQDTNYRGFSAGSPQPSGGQRPALPPPAPHDDPRADRQRRNTVTLIVLAAVVLLIALVSGVVVLTSMDGAETAGDEGQPPVPANSTATTQPPAPSPSDTAPTTPSPSATTPTPSPTPEKGPTTTAADAKTCSPGLQVPATGTSCEFAGEVKKKVAEADPEKPEFSVRASSPVTKKDYTMTCVRNSVLTTCSGGNNAVVWIHNGG